ncbi:MAG TPA: hypothetical protein ENI33_08405 [Thermoplasmatales archaeon]|nr:hypothetical protein [Thermoplasmatales archaeon]
MAKISKGLEKKIKQEVWKILIEETEKSIEKELPQYIKDIIMEEIDKAIQKYRRCNKRKLIKHITYRINKFKKIMKEFEEYEKILDKNCKRLVKDLVKDVYEVSGESIAYKMWKYGETIFSFLKSVEGYIRQFHKMPLTQFDAQQLLTFYGDMYNFLVEKILAEYVYILSKYKIIESENDEIKRLGKKFCEHYIRVTKQNKSIRRSLLLDLLDKAYPHKCSLLLDKIWRDARFHTNFYFDDKEQKYYLNGKPKHISELMEQYKQICGFCCTMINEEFKHSGIYKWLEEVENVLKKLVTST